MPRSSPTPRFPGAPQLPASRSSVPPRRRYLTVPPSSPREESAFRRAVAPPRSSKNVFSTSLSPSPSLSSSPASSPWRAPPGCLSLRTVLLPSRPWWRPDPRLLVRRQMRWSCLSRFDLVSADVKQGSNPWLQAAASSGWVVLAHLAAVAATNLLQASPLLRLFSTPFSIAVHLRHQCLQHPQPGIFFTGSSSMYKCPDAHQPHAPSALQVCRKIFCFWYCRRTGVSRWH